MLTLDTLPLPVLLQIVIFPVEYIAGEKSVVKWPFGPAESCKENAPETIALAGCNRALRRLLLPVMFKDCHFGEADPTGKYAKRLEDLARESGELLGCIRNLTVMAFTATGIKAANACIAQMTNLKRIGWYATHPVPPLFVQTLGKIPSFKSIILERFGVESLPHILPLAGQLTKISIKAGREAPAPKSAIELAPVLVGATRRSHLPWNQRDVATVEEQREAFFRDLAPFLLRAREHIEELAIDGRGLCDKGEPYKWLERLFDAMVDDNRQYPTFPRLERLWLRSCSSKTLALKHLLKTTAGRLRTLEVCTLDTAEVPPPPLPLRALKELCYFMQDRVSCVNFVNAVTEHSPLDILYLNGIRHIDILPVFGSNFRCGDLLRQLRIQVGEDSSLFTLARVRAIVTSCPNLVALEIKGNWGLEAVELLHELEPLQKLRRFAFDHPWEKPRSSLFVEADGRTIRSQRNGDFRIISVMGTSIEEEMAKRIKWDIDAARPRYRKRFGAFAKYMPALERVRWSCTEAVDWTWTFDRRIDEAGQRTILCRDDADIPYGKTIVGPKVEGGGVYMMR